MLRIFISTGNVFIFAFALLSLQCTGQSIFGQWKTANDKVAENRSIAVIEIGKYNGEICGKIIKILPHPDTHLNDLCTECAKDDPRYNKKIIGMCILDNMRKNEKEGSWKCKILNPSNGKIYNAKIWMENEKLKVRGYWMFFYRTQVWTRWPTTNTNTPE